MRRRKQDHSDTIFKLVVACAILAIIALGIWIFMPNSPDMPLKPQKPSFSTTGHKAKAPAIPDIDTTPSEKPVIKYDEKDDDLKELMSKRKAEYGLSGSVDMIVKSDESVKIGDNVVSMKEILEKIRLKKGDVLEKDLKPENDLARKQQKVERLFTKLKMAKKKYRILEKEMKEFPGDNDDPGFKDKLKEHADLEKIMEDYQSYKEILKDLNENKDLIKEGSIRKKILEHILNQVQKKEALEKKFNGYFKKGEHEEPLTRDELFGLLSEKEARYWEIEKLLKQPETLKNKDLFKKLIKEKEELRNLVGDYEDYKKTIAKIKENRELLKKDDETIKKIIENKIAHLKMRRNDLEDNLVRKLLPDEEIEVYGIHVVQPGDNIWNIHFQFLKEYFRHRRQNLSPMADEPKPNGTSSGVGKILKFSENMVHIYNITEGKVSEDINLIQPLSKIVVFNMGKALKLLDQVNVTTIDKIRFDGETLWLPSD